MCAQRAAVPKGGAWVTQRKTNLFIFYKPKADIKSFILHQTFLLSFKVINSKINRLKSNPLISRLKQKLEISLYECVNTNIKSYVKSILLLSIVAKNEGLVIEIPLKKKINYLIQ